MYPIIRAKNRTETLVQEERMLVCGDRVEYLTFPKLSAIEGIEHLFTTRLGGISKGDCATLNFSFTRGDAPEAVLEITITTSLPKLPRELYTLISFSPASSRGS